MIKSKTFTSATGDNLDKMVNEWSQENPNIKVISSSYNMTETIPHAINILYDDDPKIDAGTDAFLYKDDFLFRLLMSCYNANSKADGTKILDYEDMKKLRWHISRQCPNFNRELHTCNTARCDRTCGFFSSYQESISNQINAIKDDEKEV